MSALTLLAVGVAGGIGAAARFGLDEAVSERVASAFPFGTFAVNMTGAFALGLLAGVALSGDALRVAATGLLGGYSTFSTWMLDSDRLAEDGRAPVAAANLLGSLAGGLLAVWLGRELGTRLA